MEAIYTLQQYCNDLKLITAVANDEDEIIGRVAPLAQRLAANRSWFKEKYYETDAEQGFGVHLLHEEPDQTLAVLLINWLPGRGTPPHDHGTWAVVAGVEGVERNIRYHRIDDRSRADYAELEVKHEFNDGEGDLVCMKTGGIHKVVNETEHMTVSLHTYGKHINQTQRSQFNLKTHERTEFIVKVE